MAAFPVYPTDIPGLHTLDHALFPHAHYFAMDVGHDIMAGAAINEGDLEDAKGVAMVLKGLTGKGDHNITKDMADKAQRRVNAITAAHATATCIPVGMLGQLQTIQDALELQNQNFTALQGLVATADARLTQITNHMAGANQQLVGINDRLNGFTGQFADLNTRLGNITTRLDGVERRQQTAARLLAEAANTRIIMKNTSHVSDSFAPLHKTRAGSGHLIAVALRPNQANVPIPDNIPMIVPDVGEIPADFDPVVHKYSHTQILDQIIFYRDNFGIVLTDSLRTRAEKFRMFLQRL